MVENLMKLNYLKPLFGLFISIFIEIQALILIVCIVLNGDHDLDLDLTMPIIELV